MNFSTYSRSLVACRDFIPRSLPRRAVAPRGFTLIELLVVISIIAVLAGAGFAGGRAAMNQARKTSAQATAMALVTAIDQFYSEYQRLPNVTGSPISTTTGAGIDLLTILMGNEAGSTLQNPRRVRFLSVKQGKNNRDGAMYTTAGVITGLYDPWGEPFYVVLDATYEDRITVSPGSGVPSVTLHGRRAAVYSRGVPKEGEMSTRTIVKTW